MKSLLVISLVVVLALSLSIVPLPAQPAMAHPDETIYVDASNKDDPSENGTTEHPFDMIQEGINAASPDGGTVLVAAGTYNENIILPSRDDYWVHVLGAGADNATISGTSASNAVVTAHKVDSATKLDGFTITNGRANQHGGGIIAESDSFLTISNCIITGNTAPFHGGGISVYDDSSPTIINCIITSNNATSNWGGGIWVYGHSSPTIINCTITGNSAGNAGGGVYTGPSSSSNITNSIIYGNTVTGSGPNIYNDNSSTVNVTYSCIEGGYEGTGNIGDDPSFVGSGDYHLLPDSLCIDAGNNTSVPSWLTTDLDGNPRIANGVVDMGAYEVVEAITAYTLTVDIVGEGSVTLDPSKQPYTEDTVVTLTATPEEGWSFDYWSCYLSGSTNPDTITMTANKTVTAHFILSEYTVTTSVDPTGSGSVTADPAGPYHYDDDVELTAVPSAGYVFDHWSGDLTGSTNPETITIDGDKTVTATFTEDATSGAYAHKSETIAKLEGAKTGDRRVDRRIGKVIRYIDKSLRDKYWDGDSQLIPKYGRKVFFYERIAVGKAEFYIKFWEKHGPTPEQAINAFEEVIPELVKADQLLAELALDEANDTSPLDNHIKLKLYQRALAKAHKCFNKALSYMDKGRPSRAIKYFGKSWKYSQRAISLASNT